MWIFHEVDAIQEDILWILYCFVNVLYSRVCSLDIVNKLSLR